MGKRFTNVHRLAIAEYAVILMKEKQLKAKDIVQLLDDESTISTALQLAREDGVKDFEHFLKCAIAAGIIDSQIDLPNEVQWPSLKKRHCYRMPEAWYQAAYHAHSNISHGHLTDYIGRTKPIYLTDRALEKYVSTRNDDYRRLVATVLLVSSNKELSEEATMRAIDSYVDVIFSYYQSLPKKKKLRYCFVKRLVEASIDDISVQIAIKVALEAVTKRPFL